MPTQKLRQDTVRTLPYVGEKDKQQCIYWDPGLIGFGVRVYATGHRVYVCAYRIHRRKRLAKLGRVTVLTLDVARKKAIAYLGKVASNEDPQAATEEFRKALRIEELCDLYIEGHAKKKKKTWKTDESILRRFVLSALRGRLATSIVAADLEPIHAAVGVDRPTQANRILGICSKMVNWAKLAGHLPSQGYASPVLGIVEFPERTRKRYLTTVEMPRFICSLEQEIDDYGRHGIWLLLLTGLRSNELLCAKWEDIDWDMGTVFIGLTKNGDPLLAPLSDAARDRLNTIPRISGNPYIICGRKRGDHLKGLGNALARVVKRAGIENFRIHDLRRTVGSWLAQGGTSLYLIGNVLNHRDPKTTAGYAYFQTQQRREALSGHAAKVLALGGQHVRAIAPVPETSMKTVLPNAAPQILAATEAGDSRQSHYLRRETLYELVWTAPVLEVSRRLGVSDVALAKLCRRASVPIPYRGYWAKVDSGRQPPRAHLPKTPEGLPELLRIRGIKPREVRESATNLN
jgi:integrase